MADRINELPYWTWAQLEAALESFGTTKSDPLHQYLLDGLREPHLAASPETLLKEYLSAVVLLALRGRDIGLPQEIPWHALPSSSC